MTLIGMTYKYRMDAYCLLVALVFLAMSSSNHHVAMAWSPSSSHSNSKSNSPRVLVPRRFRTSLARFYRNDNDANDDTSTNIEPISIRRRASLVGVSLSPTGFWAMLRVAQDGYLPWQVTDDPQDARSATSPEALTMIQLLSGVDMAGAILPPDVLAKLIVYHCESLVSKYGSSSQLSTTGTSGGSSDMFFAKQVLLADKVVAFVRQSLPNTTESYSQAHSWLQSRVRLPVASLDEVQIVKQQQQLWSNNNKAAEAPFSLTCTLRDFGSLSFCPSPQALEAVLYQYSPKTSLAFTCLALALRYQAPITTVGDATQTLTALNLQTLQERFPMYATVSTLRQSSHRVQHDIVRGFEVHRLTGALKIAINKGDLVAADKIRRALDEYDSMDSLPTAALQEDGLLLQPQPQQQQPQQQLDDEPNNRPNNNNGFQLPRPNTTMSVLE